jgi:thymidylate synthase ThyX
MEFYLSSQPAAEKFLMEKHPRKPEENQAVYEKAIKAKAFDILRSFLPAGITTQLSWHTNLRQAWDKLCYLRHNPLPEVRYVAETILSRLKEKYPQSFSHELRGEQENYRSLASENYFYYKAEQPTEFSLKTNILPREIEKYADIIKNRPPKTGLPHFLTELGTITFDFLLDFGSFRDIQRHRNGVCRMPLLTTELGFNSWYLEQLPPELLSKAEKLIEEQKEAISRFGVPPEILQYYIALGFNVACRVTYGLPATVYVVELRTGKAVHPTLRKLALRMREALLNTFPSLVLNCDLDPSDWDISRGLQDIIKKEELKLNA